MEINWKKERLFQCWEMRLQILNGSQVQEPKGLISILHFPGNFQLYDLFHVDEAKGKLYKIKRNHFENTGGLQNLMKLQVSFEVEDEDEIKSCYT